MSSLHEPVYSAAVSSFYRHSNYTEKFLELISTMSEDGQSVGLDAARSCLAIGSGVGRFELEYIKRMSPGLQTFTAVEPDASSVAELRLNLKRLLPHADGIVLEKTMQEFIKDDAGVERQSTYDVVLLFQFLYHVHEVEDRTKLFSTLFDDLVRPGGTVVLVHDCRRRFSVDDALSPGNRVPASEELQAELSSAGFHEIRLYECQVSCDYSEPDDAMLLLYCNVTQRKISMKEFQEAVERVWPGGKSDDKVTRVCLFRKPNSAASLHAVGH